MENVMNPYVGWVRHLDYLDSEEKKILEIARPYFKLHIEEIYRLYLKNNEKETVTEEGELKIIRGEESVLFYYNDNAMTIPSKNIREFIGAIIGLCQEYYPLGSIIKLKNDKGDNPTYIMIIDRMISKANCNIYADYAGIVYPIGMQNDGKCLYFSSLMIDELVHKGYESQQEEVYIAMLKEDIIVGKKKIPFALGNEEEQKEF